MVRVLNCIEKWIFRRRLFNETFQNQDTPCWLMKESVTSYNGSWPPEKYTLLDQNSSEENITITILIKYLAHCYMYLHWLVAFRRHTVTALKCMVEAFTESGPELLTDTPTQTHQQNTVYVLSSIINPKKRHCGMHVNLDIDIHLINCCKITTRTLTITSQWRTKW